MQILKIYKKYKIPIVFGSDAHRPTEVAKDFDYAYKLASSAGYDDEVLFDKREKFTIKRGF